MACGYPFIYNRIPSELYDVSLVFIDENYTNRPSGSGIEMITDSIRRNARVLYLDAKQAPPLEFGIEVVFDEPVDIFVLTQVKDWLGGEISFRELQICADNFNTYYFNCYIQLNEDLVYNGGYRGIKATVKCDAPWAWEFEDEISYDLDRGRTSTIYFNNLSADTELLKPIIEFTMTNSGSFYLENKTTKKKTEFTGLTVGETITLDNLYGFIKSSTGLLRVANFNKVFFRLAKGTNEIVCGPNVGKLTIRFQNAKRIGGAYY